VTWIDLEIGLIHICRFIWGIIGHLFNHISDGIHLDNEDGL